MTKNKAAIVRKGYNNLRFDLRYMSPDEIVDAGLSLCGDYTNQLTSLAKKGAHEEMLQVLNVYRENLRIVRSELKRRINGDVSPAQNLTSLYKNLEAVLNDQRLTNIIITKKTSKKGL